MRTSFHLDRDDRFGTQRIVIVARRHKLDLVRTAREPIDHAFKPFLIFSIHITMNVRGFRTLRQLVPHLDGVPFVHFALCRAHDRESAAMVTTAQPIVSVPNDNRPISTDITATRVIVHPFRRITDISIECPSSILMGLSDRFSTVETSITWSYVRCVRTACPYFRTVEITGHDFQRSITVPLSFSSTVIMVPSLIGLAFTSRRSSGNTFSPSGVHSLICFLALPT